MNVLDVLKLISRQEFIDFTGAFDVSTLAMPISGQLFPSQYTESPEAAYTRLAKDSNIPVAANVHGWDTETYIGSRDDVRAQKLAPYLIKEKIDQGENLRRILNAATTQNAAIDYIFDDWARMMEHVNTRANLFGQELLATGHVTVNENGVTDDIDFQVPADHQLTWNWSGASTTFNPLEQIRQAARLARAAGGQVNTMMLSQTLFDIIMAHPSISLQLYGANGAGRLVMPAEVETLIRQYAGVDRVIINEERWRRQLGTVQPQEAPKYEVQRSFPENVISFFYTNGAGAAGVALRGPTPESQYPTAFDVYGGTQEITAVMWSSPDPVGVWTKATTLSIPVYPSIDDSLVIATITLPPNP